MDLDQLRCFIAVADELHFGRAARRLNILPSALSRQIRLLEKTFGTPLFLRTTRSVVTSQDGAALLDEGRALLAQAEALDRQFCQRGRRSARVLRIGATDTAAAGLVPKLLGDFGRHRADVTIQIVEDKTVRLLPRLIAGRLDLAFVRPPSLSDPRIKMLPLFHETPVVAVPSRHRLAARKQLTVAALAGQPMIVPDRSSRPHSHDLTMKLFERAGLKPTISQVAEEKQTIVNLVAARLGLAIVPRGAMRFVVSGVRFVPLALEKKELDSGGLLPLAAAWLGSSSDPLRDEMLLVLRKLLPRYARKA